MVEPIWALYGIANASASSHSGRFLLPVPFKPGTYADEWPGIDYFAGVTDTYSLEMPWNSGWAVSPDRSMFHHNKPHGGTKLCAACQASDIRTFSDIGDFHCFIYIFRRFIMFCGEWLYHFRIDIYYLCLKYYRLYSHFCTQISADLICETPWPFSISKHRALHV